MSTHVRLAITTRTPFAGGHAFDATGPYECLVGRAYFSVDPGAAAARGITDLDKAPRNAQGRVGFASDLYILRPLELARGNRRLLFEFSNRGNKRALQFFNDSPHSNTPASLSDAGNGFLMRRGYTIVWAGWQGDILPGNGRLCLEVPVARLDAGPITGRVRTEFLAHEPGTCCYPLSGDVAIRSYPAASTDPRDAVFTKRQYAMSPRLPIPASAWQYAREERGPKGQSALVPSETHVFLAGGFEPEWIYELIYPARDPLVLGVGYLVARDLVGLLRDGEEDDAGNRNPLREGTVKIEKAYCWGRSQSGRVIREFIYRGYNAGPHRRIFDAAFPHVAGAGRMWLNHRWAQPVRLPGLQHEDHYCYSDRFPFSYARSRDHLTGHIDAILKRPETDPLVIHTQTSTEYWQRRGSLVHTDTQGRDLAQPDTVRVYLWASSQHFSDPHLAAPARGLGRELQNAVSTSPLFRALLDHLDRWVTDGTPPPPSRIPRRTDGGLVTMEEWRAAFPQIPGVALPQSPNRLPAYDYGPQAEEGYITKDPPDPPAGGEEYAVLVPAVDADGNEVAGIRMPTVQAPLGTYTGWNIRAAAQSPGALAGLEGSTIPFPATGAEREATGDPRPSVEERYPGAVARARAMAIAARRLVSEGFLLEEDFERIVGATEEL